jgi:hypothetical protein
MRKLIAAAAGAIVPAVSALPAPTPALAREVTCTYTGPVSTGGHTYYYVTRQVRKNGRLVLEPVFNG